MSAPSAPAPGDANELLLKQTVMVAERTWPA
jgi:hypothetical protein